jgi:TetR/AcrR family transcriptional regulator, transcriptional repressor for nem operon
MTRSTPDTPFPSARTKLLDVAVRVVREKGYNATTIDDLCAAADVTKGAFFHHFKSKEDMAVAAANYWSANTAELFRQAAYHDRPDPLDRVLAYIDMRVDLISGALPEFTCFAGTLTQEVFLTHPAIRRACYGSIFGHAQTLEEDLAEVIEKYQPHSGLTAHSLAIHTQTVVQGAFILAKAADDPQLAVDSILHLRRYFELLFASNPSHAEATA